MADLRDKIHGGAATGADAIYLAYHDQSPWAVAKVAAGLRLTPESVAYMEKELERRKLAAESYAQQLASESQAHAQENPNAGVTPAVPHDDGQQPADGLRGPKSDAATGG